LRNFGRVFACKIGPNPKGRICLGHFSAVIFSGIPVEMGEQIENFSSDGAGLGEDVVAKVGGAIKIPHMPSKIAILPTIGPPPTKSLNHFNSHPNAGLGVNRVCSTLENESDAYESRSVYKVIVVYIRNMSCP